jgi:hypothetical protein
MLDIHYGYHYINYKRLNYYVINNSNRRALKALLSTLFPNGMYIGNEFTSRDGKFLCLDFQSGRWHFVNTGDGGGDIISLYAHMKGLSYHKAAIRLIKAFDVHGTLND